MVRPGRDRLSGRVEVDETYVGGEKPGKRGRGALGKSLVIIAAEIDGSRIGRIRLYHVADASADSLEEAVLKAAIPGSVICRWLERLRWFEFPRIYPPSDTPHRRSWLQVVALLSQSSCLTQAMDSRYPSGCYQP